MSIWPRDRIDEILAEQLKLANGLKNGGDQRTTDFANGAITALEAVKEKLKNG